MPAVKQQLGAGGLTWDNEPAERGIVSRSVPTMTPPTRDSSVVRLVADYKQATASQIKAVLFAERSLIPLQRCLKRLMAQKFLRRIGRRPAGERGGSGSYVYELGLAGHYSMTGRRDYKPHLAIDYHALMVLDCYVLLVEAERQKILSLPSEPKLEVQIDHARADMLLHIAVAETQRLYALEVEATRKRPSYILGKCRAYTDALHAQDGGTFPVVLYVVRHDWMATELRRVLRGTDAELFKVCTLDNLVPTLI